MPFHFLPQRRSLSVAPPAPAPAVGNLLSAIAPLQREDTLGRALLLLYQYHIAALPVVEDGNVIGWISEERLTEVLLEGGAAAQQQQVGEVMGPVPAVLAANDSLEQALALFQATGAGILPVVWVDNRYHGCLTRTDALFGRSGKIPTPPRIGGMATPLGVYLTTGVVRGGVGDIALMLSGVVMVCMLWLAQTLVAFGSLLGYRLSGIVLLNNIFVILETDKFAGSPQAEMTVTLAASALLIAVFLLFLRFAPKMAGFHAAEHQTVNAVEAGEPLIPASVARMPRVHPRCGTNLWGVVMLINLAVTVLALVLSTPSGRNNLSTVIAFTIITVLVIAVSWRRYGAWLQQHLTTRKASPAEIASGIRAGEEVLYRHMTTPYQPPTLVQRLKSMGLAQVIIGGIVMGYLLQLLNARLDFLWGFLVK